MPTAATRRSTRLVVREVGEETVVYDLDSDRVTCLDAATAAVWRACDGRDLDDVAAGVGQSPSDVAVAVLRLDEADLLAPTPGLSRRTLLRGIGAGVAVAPLLSIAAPAPAFAGSGPKTAIPRGTSCTNPGGGSKTQTVVFDLTNFDANAGQTLTINYSYTSTLANAVKTGSVTVTIAANGTGTSSTASLSLRNGDASTTISFTISGQVAGSFSGSPTTVTSAC